jgi:leucyl-tRNA synthetase
VKYLSRVWRLAGDATKAPAGELDIDLARTVAHTVDTVTRLVESFRLNVAIARLMELTTATRRAVDAGRPVRQAVEALVVMLAPFAPYLAEDCWARLGHEPSVHNQPWPVAEASLLVTDTVTCVVQVAGKVRDRLEVPVSVTEESLRELALASPAVARALAGRPVRTVIVRAPKLVNIVPA